MDREKDLIFNALIELCKVYPQKTSSHVIDVGGEVYSLIELLQEVYDESTAFHKFKEKLLSLGLASAFHGFEKQEESPF